MFFNFFWMLKMLEITRKNYYKCDLETIIDSNDSQFFGLIEEIGKLKATETGKIF